MEETILSDGEQIALIRKDDGQIKIALFSEVMNFEFGLNGHSYLDNSITQSITIEDKNFCSIFIIIGKKVSKKLLKELQEGYFIRKNKKKKSSLALNKTMRGLLVDFIKKNKW